MGYVYLGIAIVLELAGTSFMKLSEGFSRANYALGTLAAYGACFYFLAIALKSVKLSVAYATWGGLGIVLIVIGTVFCNFFGGAH